MLDTQFVTDHLRQFGTVELDRDAFQIELEKALQSTGRFDTLPRELSGENVVKLIEDGDSPSR